MLCEVLDSLNHDQRQYQPGEVVELPTEVAKVLAANRIVRLVSSVAPPPPKEERAEPTELTLADLKTLTIAQAGPVIAGLTNPTLLLEWQQADERKGIREAIAQRLEELKDAEAS